MLSSRRRLEKRILGARDDKKFTFHLLLPSLCRVFTFERTKIQILDKQATVDEPPNRTYNEFVGLLKSSRKIHPQPQDSFISHSCIIFLASSLVQFAEFLILITNRQSSKL